MSHQVTVGEVLESIVTLSEADIAEFAHSCGDHNPLHHDREFACRSRFGGIIACGPHYASLLMGFAATHFSQHASMLGLEFDLKFRRPVHADKKLRLSWEVVAVTWKKSLGGDLVQLKGGASTIEGEQVLAATGTILVFEQL